MAASPSESVLSGEGFSRKEKRWVEFFFEREQFWIEKLMMSGYPPGTVPISPQEQFIKLRHMKDSGDPAFWNSQKAIEEFNKMEQRFASGPPQS